MRQPRRPQRAEPTLRLREPIDLLCAVPFLIGYHPADSAVAIGLRGKRLLFTTRFDLPAAQSVAEESPAIAAAVSETMRRHGASGVVFVGYGSEERVRPVLREMRHACEAAGVRVSESLRADGGRYWSYVCRNPRCCPPEGTPYDARSGLVSAQATLAGCTALPDFASYAAQLDRVEPTEAMREASRRAAGRLIDLLRLSGGEADAARRLIAAASEALEHALAAAREGQGLDDDGVAWLSTLAMHGAVRDLCGVRIATLEASREAMTPHRAVWLDVMRRCEPDLVPAPACLFALAAFRSGDAKLAALAVDRALIIDPDFEPAWTLHDLIVHGLAPASLGDAPVDTARRKPPDRLSLSKGRRLQRDRGGRRRSSSRRAGSPRE